MPGLQHVKNRIKAIDDISRITGALEIVALTRLKNRQRACLEARPYFDKIRLLLQDVTENINFYSHPVFAKAESENKVYFILIGSDKGLCGNFNYNIVNIFRQKQRELTLEFYRLVIFGKRIIRALKEESDRIMFKMNILDEKELIPQIDRLTEDITKSFFEKKIDALYLIYSHFHQQLLGKANVIRLLPLEASAGIKKGLVRDYIYQPGQRDIFDSLVKEYLVVQVYHALLESRISEEMARMVAMKQATDNAEKLVESLNLSYHKLRQMNITRELLDIMTAIRE